MDEGAPGAEGEFDGPGDPDRRAISCLWAFNLFPSPETNATNYFPILPPAGGPRPAFLGWIAPNRHPGLRGPRSQC